MEPSFGEAVYGLLWRLTARDRVTLDIWENVAAGLYRPELLRVQTERGRRLVLVYVARPARQGEAKPGYMEVVIAAAEACRVPGPYIQSLRRWLPRGAEENFSIFKWPSHKIGEFG